MSRSSVHLDVQLSLNLYCTDLESREGRHLLLRTELYATTTITRRMNDDPMIPQSKFIPGLFLEYSKACFSEFP